MNQKEITSNIALKLGTTQKSVDDCLNALNEEIISALKTEGRVQINLGVFEVKNRAARVARVPGTDRTGPFRILCQLGKIENTKGHKYENRNRCRAIC